MENDDMTNEPDLTIVGGQPSKRKRQSAKVKVPVGLEKILYHAAQNNAFRLHLLEDREATVLESGVPLRPSERAMLSVASNADLDAMIERIEVKNPRKRKFMNLVAAAATSLAAGTAGLGGCDIKTDSTNNYADAGTGPDLDTDTDTDTDTEPDAGNDGGDN